MTGGELLKRYAWIERDAAALERAVRPGVFPLPDPRAVALDRAVMILRRV